MGSDYSGYTKLSVGAGSGNCVMQMQARAIVFSFGIDSSCPPYGGHPPSLGGQLECISQRASVHLLGDIITRYLLGNNRNDAKLR